MSAFSTALSVLSAASEGVGHAAKEGGHEEEKSKVAYYVAGGTLAAFAVIASAIGIMKPDFGRSEGPVRAVMVVALVLVLATMATTILTS